MKVAQHTAVQHSVSEYKTYMIVLYIYIYILCMYIHSSHRM